MSAADDGSAPESQPGLPVVAVVGPTAAGKSDLAVELALQLGGEIVNADSMQLYRGMDVGTAKLTTAERRGVVHHVMDVWDVTAEANVAAYQRLARAAIDDLRARGVVPVVVGGSGLYLTAVLDALDFPGVDPEVRARWERALDTEGPTALHALLAARDPQAATGILPTNGRRIVRALEVVELRGSFAATLPEQVEPLDVPIVRIGLTASREVLDERIAARVDHMWDRGLVDEVRALEAAGLRRGPTASRAIGYAQVLRMLDGELTEPEARASTAQATRRLVRRQESWFRRDARIVWLDQVHDDVRSSAIELCASSGLLARASVISGRTEDRQPRPGTSP